MVITDPRTNERRQAKEATIRIIDLVIYVAAVAGGIFALAVTPATVVAALHGWEWLTVGWGTLLIVSGAFGFIGRLSRFWVVETPGTIGAVFGGLIYLLVLGVSAPASPTAWVAVTLVFIATAALFRRFIELQIFTTDPGVRTLADRIEAALRRRTTNTVAHK